MPFRLPFPTGIPRPRRRPRRQNQPRRPPRLLRRSRRRRRRRDRGNDDAGRHQQGRVRGVRGVRARGRGGEKTRGVWGHGGRVQGHGQGRRRQAQPPRPEDLHGLGWLFGHRRRHQRHDPVRRRRPKRRRYVRWFGSYIGAVSFR